MALLASLTTFTPASGEAVTIFSPAQGGVFALPAVDGTNTAMSISNSGMGDAFLNFGTSATIPARADMVASLFRVPAGATVLVDGATASQVGTATYAGIAPTPGGCSLTFQRGTIGSLQVAGLAAAP